MVLGCETYDRLSDDAVSLVREMAKLKAAEAPKKLRGVAAHAWASRWWGIIGVGVQRAIAESLLRHGGVDLIEQQAYTTALTLADVLLDA